MPYSATRPSRLNVVPMRTPLPIMRTSAQAASTKPMPAQAPLIAVTTGVPIIKARKGKVSTDCSSTYLFNPAVPSARTERSAPAQKPLPAPVTTITRTSGSASARWRRSA